MLRAMKENSNYKESIKVLNKKINLTLLTAIHLTSCGNISKEVQNKINELNNKTETLDSILNKEIGKVLTLDSLVDKEREKVKILDTLISRTSSKLDSITKKGGQFLEKVTK
jgi:hypothetical protein